MAASASQRKQIIEALATRLRAISGAEYHYPVSHESQVSIDPTDNLLTADGYDLPMYLIEPTPDGQRTFYPADQLVEWFELNIHARYDAADADAAARMAVWENLAHDIEKAVTTDYTFGGLVYDARLGVPRPFVGVGSNIVILIQPVSMRFHRTYGTP